MKYHMILKTLKFTEYHLSLLTLFVALHYVLRNNFSPCFSKLRNALGKIKQYCYGDAGYIESFDGNWTCTFHANECFLPSNGNYRSIYKENFLVSLLGYTVRYIRFD